MQTDRLLISAAPNCESVKTAQSVVIARVGARVAVSCGDRSALCASYAVAMATAYAMAFG